MSHDHREAIAEVLAEHGRIEQHTKPSRRKGITEWAARCICGEEMPWAQKDREAAHRAHLAEALLGSDVLAQIRAEARAEGAAEVRARVEAVLEPAIRMDENGYRNAASDALLGIRAALTTEGAV